MASFTVDDEDLAEASEVLYENANMLDNEPIYKNFAAIQNDRRRQDEQSQLNTVGEEFLFFECIGNHSIVPRSTASWFCCKDNSCPLRQRLFAADC
jgi:hypothetical protein